MDWQSEISDEIETFFDVDQLIPEEERKRRSLVAIETYHSLFLELAGELKLKDTWSEAFIHVFPTSTGIIERSGKMQIDFTIGVSLFGFFMELPIRHWDQVRHMSDEFWNLVSALSALGKAELQDPGKPYSREKKPKDDILTKHNNSLIFSIARDYVLLFQNEDAWNCSLGDIRITIPLDTPLEKVRAFYKDGLRHSHRLNYLLYRSAYLKRKKIEERMNRPFLPRNEP